MLCIVSFKTNIEVLLAPADNMKVTNVVSKNARYKPFPAGREDALVSSNWASEIFKDFLNLKMNSRLFLIQAFC